MGPFDEVATHKIETITVGTPLTLLAHRRSNLFAAKHHSPLPNLVVAVGEWLMV